MTPGSPNQRSLESNVLVSDASQDVAIADAIGA
jgi:hypothetical protein